MSHSVQTPLRRLNEPAEVCWLNRCSMQGPQWTHKYNLWQNAASALLTKFTNNFLSSREFREKLFSDIQQIKWLSTRTSHTYRLTRMKICIKDLSLIALRNCKILDKLTSERHNLRMGLSHFLLIIFTFRSCFRGSGDIRSRKWAHSLVNTNKCTTSTSQVKIC